MPYGTIIIYNVPNEEQRIAWFYWPHEFSIFDFLFVIFDFWFSIFIFDFRIFDFRFSIFDFLFSIFYFRFSIFDFRFFDIDFRIFDFRFFYFWFSIRFSRLSYGGTIGASGAPQTPCSVRAVKESEGNDLHEGWPQADRPRTPRPLSPFLS